MRPIRVGLVDGRVSGLPPGALDGAASFGNGREESAQPVATAHGSNVAKLVLEECSAVRLICAQVFHGRLDAHVGSVVSAIDWLVEQGADVINMSFGTRTYSRALARACGDARDAGVLLVGAAPARGGPVFPAVLESCVGVSGDVRCLPAEVSWLGQPGADFGAHPFLIRGSVSGGGGASYAAARFSGLAGALLTQGLSVDALHNYLRHKARWRGREQRHG